MVRARVWRFRLARDADVVAELVGRGDLPVGLARLVHINALSCDPGRVLDYRTKQLEARLLVSYLDVPGDGKSLRLDHRAFAASSRHIRGFVSECSGLGVLTAVSEAIFAWKDGAHALHSFDALPKPLLRDYDVKGVRPDLLFELPAGPVAGEARGRYRRAGTLFPKKPLKDQMKRLWELAKWSADHSSHPYFMSWFYIGPSGVAVDIFLPEDDRWDTDLDAAWVEQARVHEPAAQREWRFPFREQVRGPRDELRSQLDESDSPGWAGAKLALAQVSVSTPQEQADDVVDRLYASAPESASGSALSGIQVRGDWGLADQLGRSQHEVLLGVLARHPGRQLGVRERLIRAEGRFDACLDGRLLSVVRPVGSPRPEWWELERVLLGDR